MISFCWENNDISMHVKESHTRGLTGSAKGVSIMMKWDHSCT